MTMRSCFVSILTALAVAHGLGACGGQSGAVPAAPTSEARVSPPVAASSSAAAAASAAPSSTQATPTWTMPDVNFVPARISETPKKIPRPWIETPGFDQLVARDWVPAYKIMMKVPNWEQAPPGSYLQFVLDGRPLPAVTDFRGGIKLLDLVGPEGIADGEHVLAAYACRPNHESLKGPDGISAHRFWIGKKAPDTYKGTAPMLVLGRPHGEYSGNAAYDILIDWYVLNAVVADKQYQIRLTLKGPGLPEEGVERYTKEWRPWSIVSAQTGEYTLKAELLDKNGNVAPGTWTTVTRTFTVKRPDE